MTPQDLLLPALPSPLVALHLFALVLLWSALTNLWHGMKEGGRNAHTYKGLEHLCFYVAIFLIIQYLLVPVTHWFATVHL